MEKENGDRQFKGVVKNGYHNFSCTNRQWERP